VFPRSNFDTPEPIIRCRTRTTVSRFRPPTHLLSLQLVDPLRHSGNTLEQNGGSLETGPEIHVFCYRWDLQSFRGSARLPPTANWARTRVGGSFRRRDGDRSRETPSRETTSSVVAISDFGRFARHQIDHSGWPTLAATASFPGREWLPIFPLNAPNVADTGILLCTSGALSARNRGERPQEQMHDRSAHF